MKTNLEICLLLNNIIPFFYTSILDEDYRIKEHDRGFLFCCVLC